MFGVGPKVDPRVDPRVGLGVTRHIDGDVRLAGAGVGPKRPNARGLLRHRTADGRTAATCEASGAVGQIHQPCSRLPQPPPLFVEHSLHGVNFSRDHRSGLLKFGDVCPQGVKVFGACSLHLAPRISQHLLGQGLGRSRLLPGFGRGCGQQPCCLGAGLGHGGVGGALGHGQHAGGPGGVVSVPATGGTRLLGLPLSQTGSFLGHLGPLHGLGGHGPQTGDFVVNVMEVVRYLIGVEALFPLGELDVADRAFHGSDASHLRSARKRGVPTTTVTHRNHHR